MNKYEFYGIKTVLLSVEAENLQEAISKSLDGRYNIDLIDPTTSILKNNKLIEDENGDIILSDIPPCDYHKY